MSYLYLALNIGSLLVPFLFSFHPKLKFYKLWKPLFISIVISMFIFIPWDVIFTKYGIWGFNSNYYLRITLLNLPVEEWLFFICIPYACVFTHFALLYYFPQLRMSLKTSKLLGKLLFIFFLGVAILNTNKWYTFVNFSLASVLIIFTILKSPKILQTYLLTFLVMLIPFFIVNGTLTGSFIKNEVVWYNNNENLGVRMFTIPVEDAIYAFSMILINLLVIDHLKIKKA
ncbi:hypothetical protein PK35_02415 [Tamlana nanhaiensis]|uniref:Lycopene cyclase domain-containing protein n=1 Tax=Neotamlana nanhaiensis TaxID=1382798 RepID=A0A0D7W673_9FLAO|nr:lycopene cyclase domain-containing protein [Tamlana nanhaiensis]KJD34646.1 hypothetical protein PK35_02415 [Tamlana nanhaiensis]